MSNLGLQGTWSMADMSTGGYKLLGVDWLVLEKGSSVTSGVSNNFTTGMKPEGMILLT